MEQLGHGDPRLHHEGSQQQRQLPPSAENGQSGLLSGEDKTSASEAWHLGAGKFETMMTLDDHDGRMELSYPERKPA